MVDLIKIYTDNYKLLFRIVYAYVGDIEDTKDILQDVFIRAYKASRTNIPSDKLLPWIIVIAKNRAKTFLKRKVNIIPTDDIILETSYEIDLLKFTVYDALDEMISSIPEDLRKPLKIHLVEEVPLKSIAKKHGLSYSRLRYWRKILITSLEPLIR